jgi:UTP-glucose-1-phosphate uridylyltransferase
LTDSKLKYFSDVNTGECFPSLKLLSKICKKSRPYIIKIVNELIKLGVVSKIVGHTGKSNIYKLFDEKIVPESFKNLQEISKDDYKNGSNLSFSKKKSVNNVDTVNSVYTVGKQC